MEVSSAKYLVTVVQLHVVSMRRLLLGLLRKRMMTSVCSREGGVKLNAGSIHNIVSRKPTKTCNNAALRHVDYRKNTVPLVKQVFSRKLMMMNALPGDGSPTPGNISAREMGNIVMEHMKMI